VKKKGFHNAPFKSLKGASVFPEREKVLPEAAPPAPPAEEEPDFLAAMEQLGVTRSAAADPAPEITAESGESPASAEDEPLRLDQLGRYDQLFRDQLPPEAESASAQPRRSRQLRRGRLAPEAELDLHGCDRASALTRLGHFLDNARFHGLRCVLVITGRGNRSAEGPVLRDAVERYLAGPGSEQVLEWDRAPRQHGGDGALVLFLRGS